jgi:DNA-binding NarL/FixJ family response regulator
MTPQMNAGNLFRVLLVEDDGVLNWGLTQHIRRKFQGVDVWQAETVEAAIDVIDRNLPIQPDVALQDIRVPRRSGEAPMATADVTNRLAELGVRSLFMTSYASSDDVKLFIQHLRLTDPQVAIILKNDVAAFKDNVLNHLRGLFIDLASRRISERLKSLFQTSDQLTTHHTSTASMLTLTREIAKYWEYFDEATKTRLHARFDIRLSAQGVDNVKLTPETRG